MELKKVENSSEKKLILAMLEKDYERYAEIARDTKLSKVWAKELVKKFEEQGIIVNKNIGGKSVYHLKKNRIEVKRFSLELIKQKLMSSTIGMMFCFSTAFLFRLDAMIAVIGGLQVFLPQAIDTFYRVYKLKDVDTAEIFIKSKKIK